MLGIGFFSLARASHGEWLSRRWCCKEYQGVVEILVRVFLTPLPRAAKNTPFRSGIGRNYCAEFSRHRNAGSISFNQLKKKKTMTPRRRGGIKLIKVTVAT